MFIAGNIGTAKTGHQNTVNAFLSSIPDPQNVLQLESFLDTVGTQFQFRTVITYYVP